jgi:hypothetical protein
MPGKLGMRPAHSSFSVPEEMPLHSISIRTSPSAIGVSVKDRSASLSGASNMTAKVFTRRSPVVADATRYNRNLNLTVYDVN